MYANRSGIKFCKERAQQRFRLSVKGNFMKTAVTYSSQKEKEKPVN